MKKNGISELKKCTTNVIISLFIIAGSLSPHQEIKGQFTLQQTVSIASDSSIQAFNARNNYLQSQFQYHTFKIYHLPKIVLQTTPIAYNRIFVKRYDSENNMDIYRQQQNLYSFGNLSIQQNFGLTGGQFFIDTELGYLRNFSRDNPYTQFSSVPFRITYSQNIFGFNSYKWDKQIEPIKFDKAQKEFLYEMAFIAETVVGYFFDLAVTQTAYELAKQNQANADTLYKIAEERYNLGLLNKGDLLTLKLQALNSKTTLEKAKLDLKRSHAAFCNHLRIEPPKDPIKVKLPTEIPLVDIPVEFAVQKALENNPAIVELKEKTLMAERELEQVKKTNRFSASVSASLGFNQVDNTLSAAYMRPLQQNMITVNLTIPILDWGIGKGKVAVAVENLKVIKISNDQTEKTLIREVKLILNELNLYKTNILSATETKMVADEAYKTSKELFMIGKAEVSGVNLAVSGQMEAEMAYVQALRNYWSSYFKLKRLTLCDLN